jgi:uncharacterized protein (DUF488 family)
VERAEVLTIGHSTLPYETFSNLLRRANVTAIADVRSAPYSRQFPQFNKENLSAELRTDGVAYVFLGQELGGRPRDRSYYSNGIADYERMSQSQEFKIGLDRVIEGAKNHRIALMCSERDPLDCHRCLLVGRALAERGLRVSHILSDGSIVNQAKIEEVLLKRFDQNVDDLFVSRSERLAAAYRERARKVAYTESQLGRRGSITTGQ